MNNNIGFLLLGHGSFASGVKSALDILKIENENLELVDFHYSNSINELDKKIDNALLRVSEYNYVIILCDLFGGTPFNRIMMSIIDNQERYNVLCGINLPIVIEALIKYKDFSTASELVNHLKGIFNNTLVDGIQ
ncbi:PTS sugar transporter subunit IIA [uncultured Clostridium sp.]|uniref:PTS sugar transporter subunit IIA n=1 Tax=uncultured Clostridium sp. TaxID=59620 RepID=UPI0025825C84|nr:PTS sugar transporter subunit IIA [uncultured Clostridium sp.]